MKDPMSRASDENEGRAKGDLKVAYNVRTVSPGQPGVRGAPCSPGQGYRPLPTPPRDSAQVEGGPEARAETLNSYPRLPVFVRSRVQNPCGDLKKSPAICRAFKIMQ